MHKLADRWVCSRVRQALSVMPAVVVTGARQTGKTTLVRDLLGLKDARYVSLDDADVLGVARRDPQALLQHLPVIIDEIQREPSLMLALKGAIDTARRPGMAVLTGSANLALMSAVSESLAGRASYIDLQPFSPLEWRGQPPDLIDTLFAKRFDPAAHWPAPRASDWKAWLEAGGYPPALMAGAQRDVWFAAYLQTYLERDLRQLSQLENLPDFQRLMRLAALRSARTLNISDLARDVGIPQPTCHRYMNLLETGCQVHRLAGCATNPSIPVVKARKLLWTDSGLAYWLAADRTGLSSERAQATEGFWMEQAVYQSLAAWQSVDPASRRIWYWRHRRGPEVDFVLEHNRKLVAIEVKMAARVHLSDTAGLSSFASAQGANPSRLMRSVLLHNGSGATALGRDLYALPASPLFPSRPTRRPKPRQVS